METGGVEIRWSFAEAIYRSTQQTAQEKGQTHSIATKQSLNSALIPTQSRTQTSAPNVPSKAKASPIQPALPPPFPSRNAPAIQKTNRRA